MTEPTDAEIEAAWTDATGSSILPYPDDMRAFVRAVLAKWGTPQPTKAVNQADRPFIVRLAEDFAEECVTAGYVTTKAASYGRLMDEVLSSQAQAGAVPLTDGQIRAMAREHPAEDLCGWSYRMGVADAERHHGITGGQHGAE